MIPNGDCNRYDSSLPAGVYQRERAYRCSGELGLRIHDEQAAKRAAEWTDMCASWEAHLRDVRTNSRRWRFFRWFFGIKPAS